MANWIALPIQAVACCHAVQCGRGQGSKRAPQQPAVCCIVIWQEAAAFHKMRGFCVKACAGHLPQVGFRQLSMLPL